MIARPLWEGDDEGAAASNDDPGRNDSADAGFGCAFKGRKERSDLPGLGEMDSDPGRDGGVERLRPTRRQLDRGRARRIDDLERHPDQRGTGPAISLPDRND